MQPAAAIGWQQQRPPKSPPVVRHQPALAAWQPSFQSRRRRCCGLESHWGPDTPDQHQYRPTAQQAYRRCGRPCGPSSGIPPHETPPADRAMTRRNRSHNRSPSNMPARLPGHRRRCVHRLRVSCARKIRNRSGQCPSRSQSAPPRH